MPNVIENQPLNLRLSQGEEIKIANTGNCPIDLTGNYIYLAFDDDEDDEELYSDLEDLEEEDVEGSELEQEDDDDDEVSDEDEEMELFDEDSGYKIDVDEELTDADIEALLAKRKGKPIPKSNEPAAKKSKIVEVVEEVSASEEDEDEEEKPVKKEQPKKQAQKEQPKKQEKPTPKKEEKPTPKKEEKPTPKKDEKPTPKKEEVKKENKKTLPSGLVIEDSIVGQGPRAKNGKRVAVRYIGKLMNGKVFDSNTKGAPFTFKLGKGDVIKGWDIGIQGMNVGGSRKLTIPANLAYGSRGAPPDIPANATLQFEVKLLEVKN